MNANWIILVIGLAGGALPTWLVTSNYYQGVIAKEHVSQQKLVIEQQEETQRGLLAYANRITKAGADHDKNTAPNDVAAVDEVKKVRYVVHSME